MAAITLKGNPIHTAGDLPKVGTKAPDFNLSKTDLSLVNLSSFAGKKILLNIFPSIDTPVCATSVRRFNEQAASLPNTVVLCVSKDLPFAHKRFCGAEGIEKVLAVSAFRDSSFGQKYGVEIVDGPLAGLFSRAIVALDDKGQVVHTEQVKEIAEEPNYQAALNALK